MGLCFSCYRDLFWEKLLNTSKKIEQAEKKVLVTQTDSAPASALKDQMARGWISGPSKTCSRWKDTEVSKEGTIMVPGTFRCKCVFVLIVMGRASCIGCWEASNFLKDFVKKIATTLFHSTLDIDLRS